MASDKKMLAEAASVAVKKSSHGIDKRSFFLGAVGLRNDGVFVSSRNAASTDLVPDHHAEARLVRKMTPDSTVWVARVARKDGNWAMAKPCPGCERRLRASGVTRVVYTIGPGEWGVIDMKGAVR
jgi:tRNA(Arg) A34 adenosine deaminase TadA